MVWRGRADLGVVKGELDPPGGRQGQDKEAKEPEARGVLNFSERLARGTLGGISGPSLLWNFPSTSGEGERPGPELADT